MSFNVFLLTKILVRGGLALVNEHLLHLQTVETANHSRLIPYTLCMVKVLIQRNLSYRFRKWWASLVVIFEQKRAWSIM